jgi:hypothetical protein
MDGNDDTIIALKFAPIPQYNSHYTIIKYMFGVPSVGHKNWVLVNGIM